MTSAEGIRRSRFIDDFDTPVHVTEEPIGADGVDGTMTSRATANLHDGVTLAAESAPSGGDKMPWHKVRNHAECADGEWAVVKDASGEVEGCHATEDEADAQLAALYASEKKSSATAEETRTFESEARMPDENGECGDGYVKLADNTCVTLEKFERMRRWRGTLVVEGVTTGDGREFAPEALKWDENALIRWQKEGAHGGSHDVTVTVGRIDRTWREGNRVMGEGVLDLRSKDGLEIRRRLDEGFAGGISIDADDIANPDIEVVWPESPDGEVRDEETDVMMMLFGHPEKIVFHGGRIRAATLVDIPAFVEARIALIGDSDTPEPNTPTSTPTAKTFATAPHVTNTTDVAWEQRKIGLRREGPREAYAWSTEQLGVLLHHEFDGDELGAANLTACAAAIAQLNSKRGIVPSADERAVYEHLAAHLRDAGLTPPPFKFDDSITASVTAQLDDFRPPAVWFENPGLTVPVGITVTDQGRVYGHAAQWGECHVGFDDICVTPPHEDDHSYFMTGEVVCDDGKRVAVGQITVATGHAPLSYGASRTVAHYDNTGVAVADVAVGNDSVGIWVAGAIRPHAEQARVHDLRASGRVSGDWRRIGTSLRLVGLLGVNVAGFPLHTRARVASGVPTSLVAAGFMSVGTVLTKEEQDTVALKRVMGMLAARVHGK